MASSAPDDWVEGCKHYKRFCKLIAPCCGNTYSCRFCHDEKEDHKLNRYKVSTIICVFCATSQWVKSRCEQCGTRFGEYFCLICKLFDNEDKGQFHCKDCGLCRIGGQANYYHCEKCNLCLSLQLIGNHVCVENASHTDCPVCIEDIHTSRIAPHVPSCGHLLHQTCFEELKKSGRHTCPVCQAKY